MEQFILQMFSDRGWEYFFNKFGYGYLMYRKYKVIKDWYFIAENCFNQPSCRLCRHPPLHKEGKFVVCSVWYFIAKNRIKQFAQSISQSADADSSLYQREPCCSFGLKCWFTTEQVYQREPVLRFVWFIDLQGKIVQSTLLSALPTPSLAQGGQVCGLFGLVFHSGK